jgi:hypothetical protein
VSRRTAVLLWVLLGAALWNGVFDLYISRGAREYLQRQAEFELHRGPEPSMAAVMAKAKHDGAVAASLWAAAVVACGLVTIAGRRYRH